MRSLLRATALACWLPLTVGCGGKDAAAPVGGPPVAPAGSEQYRVRPPRTADRPPAPPAPKPPLAIAVPPAQPKLFDNDDLSAADADELLGLASQAAEGRKYKLAVQAQYWAVKKSGGGRYNLACYYARAKKVEEALYFLQEAAALEGVEAEDARNDDDLAGLRRDPRFGQLLAYVKAAGDHAALATPPESLCYLPANFDASKPTPVVLLLHGRGSRPADFLGDRTQGYADKIGVPIISVSGTVATGPKSFVWAVNYEKDFTRLDDAVQKHAAESKFQPDAGRFVAVGFSEGAQVGLDVALRYPVYYAGAIAMSPGAAHQLEKFTPTPLHKKRSYVVTIGQNETPGNRNLANIDSSSLSRWGIPVELVTVPKGGHALPPDFDAKFPEWVARILAAPK